MSATADRNGNVAVLGFNLGSQIERKFGVEARLKMDHAVQLVVGLLPITIETSFKLTDKLFIAARIPAKPDDIEKYTPYFKNKPLDLEQALIKLSTDSHTEWPYLADVEGQQTLIFIRKIPEGVTVSDEVVWGDIT